MNAKRLLLFLAFFVVIGIVITARSGGPAAVLGQGYTGAPSEGTCTSCHSGGSYGTVTPVIQIFQQGTSTPVTAYAPGTQYDMRVTVNNSTGTPVRYGFQMTALRVTGNQALAGYSNLAAGIQQIPAAGRTYVEHSTPSVSNQFNFRWTAPAAGSGSVRFYASGNCVNNNGGSNGDVAASASLLLPELLPLAATGTQVNVSCFGGSNGSINLTPSGGTLPYSFLWNDGNTNEDRTGLTAGTYSVTVTDGASATTSTSFTITQPPVLGLTASVGSILCYGGTATVTIAGTGGTPPYTGAGTSALAAGTYTRTVTDSKGCTHDTTFTITQPDSIDMDVTVNGQVPCSGAGTTVTVTASGGTGTLSGTGTFTVLTAGNHTYTVTDANSCSKSVTVTVQAVSGLTVSTDLTMPTCTDTCSGVLDADIQTTSLPFTQSLVTVPGGQPVANFNTLCPGSYAYTVTDNAGCTYEDTLEIVLPAPPTVIVDSITPSSDASDGAVDITVTGGLPPYTYAWLPGGQTTQDLEFVQSGTYSVTVTDANGCETEVTGIVVPVGSVGITETETVQVAAYPNPFVGAFQLSVPEAKVLAVRDISGRKVAYRQTGQAVRLDCAVAGIYFIHVELNGKTAVLKLIAE